MTHMFWYEREPSSVSQTEIIHERLADGEVSVVERNAAALSRLHDEIVSLCGRTPRAEAW